MTATPPPDPPVRPPSPPGTTIPLTESDARMWAMLAHLSGIILLASAVLIVVVIGAILLPIVWIFGIVFMIIAGLAANQGQDYRYPFTLRLVK